MLRFRLLAFASMVPCGALVSRAQSTQNLAPHLLLTIQDFARVQVLAKRQPWAAEQRDMILKQAAEYPAAYEQEFGLTTPEIPPEGGQWLHYYGCPQTGTKLVFHPPADHVCPDDGKVFHGYPYDQVVYMLRADALGRAALSSGLAYQLAGDRVAAKHAAAILLGYADRYAAYPLHDNNGKQSNFFCAGIFPDTGRIDLVD